MNWPVLEEDGEEEGGVRIEQIRVLKMGGSAVIRPSLGPERGECVISLEERSLLWVGGSFVSTPQLGKEC